MKHDASKRVSQLSLYTHSKGIPFFCIGEGDVFRYVEKNLLIFVEEQRRGTGILQSLSCVCEEIMIYSKLVCYKN